MCEILRLLGEAGVTVVCSAGNDATARPMFRPPSPRGWTATVAISPPATTAPRSSRSVRSTRTARPMPCSPTPVPGFRVHEHGAAIFSTIPETFNGGLQPVAPTVAYQRERAFDRPGRLPRAASRCGAGHPFCPGLRRASRWPLSPVACRRPRRGPAAGPKGERAGQRQTGLGAVTPLVDLRAVHRRKDEREVGERMWQRPV